MYAIIATGGKQYLVKKGDKLKVESLAGEEGGKLTLDQVLLTTDGTDAKLGTPFIEKASVEAKILKQGRGDKIVIFKKKSKKRYSVTRGHRQNYTELEITEIKA